MCVDLYRFYRSLGSDISSERVSHFSLGFWAIRPSDSFEPRRKAVLHGEDNAWTPVLRSFDKLCEVGVSYYLFYSWFNCFIDVCVGLRS